MRIRIVGLGLVAAAAMATPSHAAELPTIDVRVADRAVVLDGEENLGRGPIRLNLERNGGGEPRTVVVIELKPGHTAEEIGPLSGLVEAGPRGTDPPPGRRNHGSASDRDSREL